MHRSLLFILIASMPLLSAQNSMCIHIPGNVHFILFEINTSATLKQSKNNSSVFEIDIYNSMCRFAWYQYRFVFNDVHVTITPRAVKNITFDTEAGTHPTKT